MAEQLRAELARRNVPTWDAPPVRPDEVAISVWYGLVAYTDGGRVWWKRPHRSMRGRPLLTYAQTLTGAADRLAADYAAARARPIPERLWQVRPHPRAAAPRHEGLSG
ncbi:hypothetical protein SAMN04489764_0037 [Thermostaphylospora chromogena]|nr:hypothetical protein SAMN04489764_0014 [Thermostaphylospora chromogena]SDQ03282.1 hypothetical protein SAMN04489764_0037 [Thermostaphylospora chromogena]